MRVWRVVRADNFSLNRNNYIINAKDRRTSFYYWKNHIDMGHWGIFTVVKKENSITRIWLSRSERVGISNRTVAGAQLDGQHRLMISSIVHLAVQHFVAMSSSLAAGGTNRNGKAREERGLRSYSLSGYTTTTTLVVFTYRCILPRTPPRPSWRLCRRIRWFCQIFGFFRRSPGRHRSLLPRAICPRASSSERSWRQKRWREGEESRRKCAWWVNESDDNKPVWLLLYLEDGCSSGRSDLIIINIMYRKRGGAWAENQKSLLGFLMPTITKEGLWSTCDNNR